MELTQLRHLPKIIEFKYEFNLVNYKTENENRKREKEERPHLDLTWPSSPLVAQQHRPNTSPVPLR
jgi:hypothetical protein